MIALIDLLVELLKVFALGGDQAAETKLLHGIIRAANDEIARRSFGA